MINPNWNRWIIATITQFFYDRRQGYNLYLEDQQKRDLTDSFEIRVVGPIWDEFSRNKFIGQILINILIRTVKDDSDFHKIYKMSGIIQTAFERCILIKKYGNQEGDDSNIVVGELSLISKVSVENYGQIEPAIPLLQMTVEADYKTNSLRGI